MNSTRLSVLSGLLLLLAACATTTPVSATPIEASTQVMVPCKIPIPQRTPFAVDTLPIGASIWDQMAALRAERLQRIGYIEELKLPLKAPSKIITSTLIHAYYIHCGVFR